MELKLKENERLDDLQYKSLKLIQNENHYCFTSDAVLLANFVKAKKTDRLVDLCSGSGVVGMLAQSKTDAKHVTYVELQEELADMCNRSVIYNHLEDVSTVVNKPLQNVHKLLGAGAFDVVICNPPYKMQNSSILNVDKKIAICKHEITVTLEEIILEASKLLKFGGYFYTVNKEERLTDLMVLMRKFGIEPKVICLCPSPKGASVVLLKGIKGGNSGVKIELTNAR